MEEIDDRKEAAGTEISVETYNAYQWMYDRLTTILVLFDTGQTPE